MNMDTKEKKKPLVFVADDDITVRMLARECLEQAGFDVEEAENGREAVDRFAEVDPDAVMLDVLMPEMDGYAACEKIRTMPGNSNLPILMMTALDDVESINAAYKAGASEFTAKPVNWTIEAYRLQNMLRFSSAVRQVDLARREWERTFNALDELVIVFDTDMTIVRANNAAIAAASNPMSSVQGKDCTQVYSNDPAACGDCPIRQALNSGEKITAEWDDSCFGGTFLISVFPVPDAAGSPAQTVCLAKDITERKRLDDELRCAQKMDAVGTLAGGLAHDFNNLLQIISGHAEISLIGLAADGELYENLDTIRSASQRGGEITRQLMSVSRNVESHLDLMMLNDTVAGVETLLSRTFPKNISIELNLAEDLNWVHADSAQIEQVIMNLAVNARHAMPDGGGLYFETRNVELDQAYCRMHPNAEPGNYVMFSVTDTGCGMDTETQARIFEPFFTTRSAEKGSGLGLAMVYGIVQKHRGHTVCYSEIGEGTTFKIYMPAVEGTDGALRTEPASEQRSVGGDELILLVDDEPDIRNIAKKILIRAGYRVMLASDGQEALKVLQTEGEEVDLIVLDLNMPVMGGLECLDRLRAGGSDTPVLLASGFALNGESRRRLSDSVQYLNKPYQVNEFLQSIRAMLNAEA